MPITCREEPSRSNRSELAALLLAVTAPPMPAAEGMRFTGFSVNAPIYSPARVALTTGQYPHRWRITSYRASGRRRGFLIQ